MILPKKILDVFEKESKGLQFGKISIGIIIRDGHCHYEIDKHFTIMMDEDSKINPVIRREK
jgi:hypothetical protein